MAAESIENKYSKYILVKGSKLSTFNLRDQRRNLKDPNVFNLFVLTMKLLGWDY